MNPNAYYEPGLSFRRYREIGKNQPILTVNATILKEPTPLHSKHAMEDDDGSSEALSVGDALHKAVLEPDAFDNHFEDFYMWSPTKGLDTKAAIEARAMNPDKILLTPELKDKVQWMRDSVYRHPDARKLLETCTLRELSGVAPDKDLGIARKIRVDACEGDGTPGAPWTDYLVDIKTTRKIHTPGYDIKQFNYDIQAAFYIDTDAIITGRKRSQFFFIFVSSVKPYCTRVKPLLPEQLDKGREIYMHRIAALAQAALENQWFAYEHEGIVPLAY